MMLEETREISLVDIARVFKRHGKLFLIVLLVPILCAVLIIVYQMQRTILAQRLIGATYVSGSLRAPIQDGRYLANVVLSGDFAQRRFKDITSKIHLPSMKASVLVVRNPPAMSDKKGEPILKYVPNSALIELTAVLKNKSAAHVAQAIEQFNTALMQLQVYQAPRLKLYKDNWDEQVLQAQQKLADITKLYNHVQKMG